jgi:hypothetical protein
MSAGAYKYENISQILVEQVNVDVPQEQSNISRTTIGSRGIGPCLVFLFDFILNNQPICFLYHYSFPFDETVITSRRKTVLKVLSILIEKLKSHLLIPSILPEESGDNKLSNFRPLICGSNEEEGTYIRESFILLQKK